MNDAEDVVVGSHQRLAVRLCRRRAERHEGAPAHLARQASPTSTASRRAPQPELIAWAQTPSPALAVAKGLDRDRAVDETGGQIAVFGRLGSRPFTRQEMERLFLNSRRYALSGQRHGHDAGLGGAASGFALGSNRLSCSPAKAGVQEPKAYMIVQPEPG